MQRKPTPRILNGVTLRRLVVLGLAALLPMVWPALTWSAGTEGTQLRKSWSTPVSGTTRAARRPAARPAAKAQTPRASRLGRETDPRRSSTAASPSGKLRWRSQPTEVRHWRPVSAPVVVRASNSGSSSASRRVLDPFERTPLASTRSDSQAVRMAAAEAAPSDPLGLPGQGVELPAALEPADSDAATVGPGLSSEGFPSTENLPPPRGLSLDDDTPPPPGIEPGGPALPPPAAANQFPPPAAPDQLSPMQRFENDTMTRARDREMQQEECDTATSKLRANRLSKIALDIGVPGTAGNDFPVECALGTEPAPSRAWSETIYTWKASGVCHKPLYFNEFAVERHGHSKGPFVQPLYSGAHFYANLVVLPYKMGLRPPTECIYALGHYRAGSCAPYLVPTPPLSVRAGLAQAGAVVGVAAILP